MSRVSISGSLIAGYLQKKGRDIGDQIEKAIRKEFNKIKKSLNVK